jgi:hypothetical protein
MAVLASIADPQRYPLATSAFRDSCRKTLAETGILVLPVFLLPEATERIRREGDEMQNQAYFCIQNHNAYLSPPDPDYPADHPRNREVVSSKGCITDDQVAKDSPLRTLYDSKNFRDFLCAVLGEQSLYEYADPLSSINLNYANRGQELGWHFDNSSFSITLMVQAPEGGGAFEYVTAVRDADAGEMSFETTARVLDGDIEPQRLIAEAGTLVLFRGRNAIHRVAPVAGNRARMLAVLAYNSLPGIALSEPARMTFFGRLM